MQRSPKNTLHSISVNTTGILLNQVTWYQWRESDGKFGGTMTLLVVQNLKV